MTIYLKELIDSISVRYGELNVEELAKKLLGLGVIDHTLCKVLIVRDYVEAKVASGSKKLDAMWEAAEHFSCSYEYVRKCVYYYTDINFN